MSWATAVEFFSDYPLRMMEWEKKKKTVGARQSASQLAVEKISKVEEEVKKKIHPILASIHPSIQQGIISS